MEEKMFSRRVFVLLENISRHELAKIVEYEKQDGCIYAYQSLSTELLRLTAITADIEERLESMDLFTNCYQPILTNNKAKEDHYAYGLLNELSKTFNSYQSMVHDLKLNFSQLLKLFLAEAPGDILGKCNLPKVTDKQLIHLLASNYIEVTSALLPQDSFNLNRDAQFLGNTLKDILAETELKNE